MEPSSRERSPVRETGFDVAVVGAGAAGLTAAIFASRSAEGIRVAAFDGAPRIGAKILISGGGRCNVTHHQVTAADFNGNRNAIARVLRSFPVDSTVEWFSSLGVTLKREETGKLFPVTDRAATVVQALVGACSGVALHAGTRVTGIVKQNGQFAIETERGVFTARTVILATGGRSVPKTGSDGYGYGMARSLGHTVTEVFPALVPLLLPPAHWATSISGTSVGAEMSVVAGNGRVLARARGPVLFTHFGISGPATLDISRHWIAASGSEPAAALVANFLPGESHESLDPWLVAETRRNPHATIASVLRGRLPERLLAIVGGDPVPLGRLKREQRRQVVRSLIEQRLPVTGSRGFDYAEVTAGGVPLNEIELATMESRRCAGLYLCGEILDVDGRIGGFNFQWAWASGRLAGLTAARAASLIDG